MKLLFDWSDSFFETKESWHGDENMISLKISQYEGSFASAKVLICAQNSEKLLQKQYAQIGVQRDEDNPRIDLLFSGRLVAFPVGFSDGVIQLELIAEPENYRQQLKTFIDNNLQQYQQIDMHTTHGHHIPFDDLFFSQKDLSNPTIFLENDVKMFHWSMRTGLLSLSNIAHGEQKITISGDQILQDSLKVRLAREPYKNVNVVLEASWIQRIYGYVDLYPIIASNFKTGYINSFTNIKAGLEKLCSFPSRSSYHLIHCRVNEMTPPHTATYVQKCPAVSQEFLIDDGNDGPKSGIATSTSSRSPSATSPSSSSSSSSLSGGRKRVQFRRFYFHGKMLIGWNYQQKRHETVRVKITNEHVQCGREKTLYLRLNRIQLAKRYPFWYCHMRYEIGAKIIRNGFVWECTRSHLSLEQFEETKWKLKEKIPDALQDDAASSFFATNRGKNAIKYAIQKAIALITYSSRYIEINLSVDAGTFLFATINDQITIVDNRFQGGKVSGKIIKTNLIANANGRILNISIACCPYELAENYLTLLNDYVNTLQIAPEENLPRAEDIVRNVEVVNSPEEQEDMMAQLSAKSIKELENQLKAHGTKIKVALHPFSTTREIAEEIDLPEFSLSR
ncbi:MAG: hypothetical protein LBT90_03030 [Holosporaceae bacterium]|jgi:hypothetical protein|nr:hypothetical protein [Holosporaceae bacterium]